FGIVEGLMTTVHSITATQKVPTPDVSVVDLTVRLVSWYDNEWGYSSR
uniref:Glyceraldehyde-3-phosphate dehydrogenase, cytosolic (Fragments) n=1 Tax=Pseudotsuga menziesii TaxID=3357 RepID=G3PC_PSEMZ|nr:RecName: Full=Glyceraldehyde-3-phosphate dehydrogenase, cytosolic [Pseudotsuga menziesii]